MHLQLSLTPARRLELAREYLPLDRDGRQGLYASWLTQYGDDTAYDLFLTANVLIAWPEDPAAFRAQWSASTVRDPELREAVARLTDDQLQRAGEALRDAQLNHPSEVGHVLRLVKSWAGVA